MNSQVMIIDFYGQQRAVIVGKDHNPISHIAEVTYANGWLSNQTSSWLQEVSNAQPINTQVCYARALLNVLNYLDNQCIHIVHRVKTGLYMSLSEIDKLARNACLKSSAQQSDNVLHFPGVSTKQFTNIAHTSQNYLAQRGVANSTAKIRLLTFKWFVEYLHEIHHETCPGDSPTVTAYTMFNKQLQKEIKKLKTVNSLVDDPFEKAIPDMVMEKLESDLQTNSPNNPFKSSKLRNECIWRVFIDTGVRNGAIAKLKLSDLRDDGVPRLHITRTPNDPTDTRKYKPAQKTRPGLVPISSQTRDLLLRYIETRNLFPRAMKHDFLFLSEKGRSSGDPLAIKTYAYLFQVISRHVQFHITPHTLRYWWAENFDEKAEQAGINGETKGDMHKLLMTHSSNSKMAMIYNKKRIFKKAQAIKLNNQKQMSSKYCDDTREDKS